MNKYVKVMFGTTSGANNKVEYKLNEINIADNWNPLSKEPKEMGGFNFSTEDKILRWLIRGDTIYDVSIPDDADVIDCDNNSTPHGVFKSNKIIISNPRIVTDNMAIDLYLKSNIPEKSYYKSLIGCAIRGYRNTCLKIITDRVNKDNIDLVISEAKDFVTPQTSSGTASNGIEVYNEVMEYLHEIKSNLLISRFIDKEPYIKQLTDDKIINLTGESGSGKSYYANKYLNNNDYIVIDTDIVFSDKHTNDKVIIDLRNIFKDKSKDYLITDFDDFYTKILDFFKNTNKIIVIDSAQFRNIKNCSILKGKIVVIRTSIETCYQRCINRWIKEHPNYTKEELEKYASRKKGIFSWYKSINTFIENVEKLSIKNNKR